MKQNERSRIAVVGAGAIGSVVGGLLAHAGEDVTLIARMPHVEAINRDGLFMDGVRGEFTVDVKAAEQLDFRPDIVLLTAKTHDVPAACTEIKAHAQGVPIVTMQNGLQSDEMAALAFGKENTISCVLALYAKYLEPGRATFGSDGTLVIGNQFGANGEREQEIVGLLSKAMKCEISADIVGVKWTKLLLNIGGNSLTAITGLNAGEFADQSGLCRIAIHIFREALDIVDKGEIELAGWTGFTASDFTSLIKSPLDEAAEQFGAGYRRNPTLITSTLQSMLRGKPPEIDYLNGEIVRQGQALGVPTPCNAKAVELVHAVAKTRRFLSPEDAVREISLCASG